MLTITVTELSGKIKLQKKAITIEKPVKTMAKVIATEKVEIALLLSREVIY